MIFAVISEETHNVYISRFRRHTQRSAPVVSQGRHVRTALDEGAYHLHVSLRRRDMQRSPPALGDPSHR